VVSGNYRRVLREPGVRWLLGTSLVARLPASMTSLAIILRISRGTGSYTRAGIAAACYVAGAALFGPVLGRIADRLGRHPVLLIASCTNAVGVIVLSQLSPRLTTVISLLALVAGACTPPVAASIRSLWPHLVPRDSRPLLYSLDATLQELSFLTGPALVALLGYLAGTAAPLVGSATLGLSGTIALASHTAVRSANIEPHRARGLLRTPGLAAVLSILLFLMIGIGIENVAVVAFAGVRHASGQAGLLLAVESLGSLVGGTMMGPRATSGGSSVLPTVVLLTACGFGVLALASRLFELYLLLFLAGTVLAPAFGCIYAIMGALAPQAAAVEAFSWTQTAILSGLAIGPAVAGVLAQNAGARVTFLAAAASGIIAVVLSRLRPAPRLH
jgi:MFS family permease